MTAGALTTLQLPEDPTPLAGLFPRGPWELACFLLTPRPTLFVRESPNSEQGPRNQNWV